MILFSFLAIGSRKGVGSFFLPKKIAVARCARSLFHSPFTLLHIALASQLVFKAWGKEDIK